MQKSCLSSDTAPARPTRRTSSNVTARNISKPVSVIRSSSSPATARFKTYNTTCGSVGTSVSKKDNASNIKGHTKSASDTTLIKAERYRQ